jgi:DNA adenine methylase
MRSKMRSEWIQSAFRYPGGKSRWAEILHWPLLKATERNLSVYVEPFVGGGSTLLAAAQMRPDINEFVVNDTDRGIYAFWCCIANPTMAEALASRYETTTPTVALHDDLQELRVSPQFTEMAVLDAAFIALFLNRTSFDGIVTSGPMGGKQQTAGGNIEARYCTAKVARSIRGAAALLNGRLRVHDLDCCDLISWYDNCDTALYLDPPYVQKGAQLYPHAFGRDDHVRLAETLRQIKAEWLLSYDNCDEVRDLYGGWAYVKGIGIHKRACPNCDAPYPSKSELVILPKAPTIPRRAIRPGQLKARLADGLLRYLPCDSAGRCLNCGSHADG